MSLTPGAESLALSSITGKSEVEVECLCSIGLEKCGSVGRV
jgi:hypothetical protein